MLKQQDAKEDLIKFLLDTDIREYGEPLFPADVNTATRVQSGKFILQVVFLAFLVTAR